MLTGKDVILVMWPPYRKDWCFLPSVKEAHFYAGLLLVSNSLRNSWEAGVIENGAWFPTEEGTPQGGVCSPLLANIALHGLEQEITAAFPALVHGERWKPTVVRYADDLVVLHSDKAVVEQVQQLVSTWLASMGLVLKPSK